jgi:N-acetylglucosaminyldiphosphoundecaprenol N-acetyl-beta-D-mannosaminyltransferase
MSKLVVQISSIQSQPKVRILDLDLDRIGMAEVMERWERYAAEDRPSHVVTANLQFMSLANKDPEFASLVRQTDLVVADGMPIKWISKLTKAPITDRITGHDLLNKAAELSSQKGYRMYLLGGMPGAAIEAADKFRDEYPGLAIKGNPGGKFSAKGDPDNADELFADIDEFQPDFVFVALGCPKQEYFISRYKNRINAPVSVGVGCAFEVLIGRFKRAPRWMQRTGTEWVFRLAQEPGRLWKRYLLTDLPTTLKAVAWVLANRANSGGRQ